MEFKDEFEYAQEVIKIAGELLLAEIENKPSVSFKSDASMITQIDKELEQLIRNKLTSRFSDYGFLGEEGEENVKDISWIVDPIDGTIAFTRQIPEFGIVIALKKGNEVIFSVQYIPAIDMLLTAYKDHGAFGNNKPIQINNETDPRGFLFSVSFHLFWEEKYQKYALNLLQDNRRFRVGHSSLVESYYLASGKTDVYIRFNQPIWDVAAECLLMKEAGAIITDEFGEPLTLHFSKSARHNYIATSEHISQNFKDLLYRKKS